MEALRGSASLDPVLAHLAMQVGAIDAERGRGLGDVASCGLECLADRVRLAPLDLAAQSHRIVAAPRGLEPEHEVLGMDGVPVDHDGRAFHEVAELADVPRPRVALE